MNDNVSHPSHYTRWPVEVIDLTERESFLYGNVLKYALRAGAKPGAAYEEDMAKAVWYATRYVNDVIKAALVKEGLRSLWQHRDDAVAYLNSRPEDTAEMREHLQDQLTIIHDRVKKEVTQTWDAI